MDPITALIAVAAGFAATAGGVEKIGRMTADAAGDRGPYSEPQFDEFYPKTARGEMPDHEPYSNTRYDGDTVSWIGTRGRMFPVDPAYMSHIDGNIFDPAKIEAVVSGIHRARQGEGPPLVFYAPYGQVGKIDIIDIRESMEYLDSNQGRPLTTGDEELDLYIKDPKEALEDWDYNQPEDEGTVFHEELEMWLDAEGLEELEDLERRLAEAKAEDWGDLGKWSATIRDGNHRAFGAALAGEHMIWMTVMENDVDDARQAVEDPENHKGPYWDKQRELFEHLR